MNNHSTALAVFKFKESEVRTVVRDGEPWFVCVDVALALGYRNAPDASRHLDADEKGTQIVRTPGGEQKLTIINESGLYALVLRSRKPEARKFAKWVTAEVLPSIRKTGKYDARTHSGPLTKEMQRTIKELVVERAKQLPHDKQASAIIKAWSALKSHFGVSYKEIPAEKYTEALSLVARMQVEWEIVDEPMPDKPAYHYPLSAADPHDREMASVGLSPRVLLDPKNRQLEVELLDQLAKEGHDVEGARIRILAMREAMAFVEMTRGRLASWEARLEGLLFEVKSYQAEQGKNVLFSRAPNSNCPVERHVYRDQMQHR